MILEFVGGSGSEYTACTGVDLLGVKDGSNLTFTTPQPFVQEGCTRVGVYRNGQRLRLGTAADYTVAEGGGPGTGFDTVILNGPAPQPAEELTADYQVQ